MRILSVSTLLLLGACGRDAGPNPDEYGKITYWLLSQNSSERSKCTDQQPWTGAMPEEPVYTPGIAWYVIYKVASDGKNALDMDCERTNVRNCVDGDIVFGVQGHEVVFERESDAPTSTTCTAHEKLRFVLTDDGDEAQVVARADFSLAGDPAECEQAQADMRSRSGNGQGIDGCAAIVRLRMVLWGIY